MDDNSLMLIDNHGSFEMDDQAHMDKDATENNALVVFVPTTPIADADDGALLDPDTQPGKRRRKKSMVWEHFTIETVSPGSTKASCKHCKKSFAYITGSKLAGTSHLKRHIALGICPVGRQNNHLTLTPETKDRSTGPPKKRQRSSVNYTNIPLDQDRCYHEMAKMMTMHEYPLHMVEHPGFIGFVQSLQPRFSMASFNTIHGDCVSMYLSEKQKLTNLMGEIPGRVNLTIDLWTSNQSVGYAFLTGHFIDRDWNLTRRLLNVLVVPCPDSDFALNQPVAACLSDWNLERKLSSLTVDQSVVNKTAIENLRGFLSVRNPHVLNGQLLIGRCYARLISSMAQDALSVEDLETSIKKVRDSVKYVKTSDSCEESFYEVKRQLQAPSTKDLFIDDQTKWNTTYNMLLAACEHKEVFSCLETCDPNWKTTISAEEWRKVEILCSRLKVLFDAASVLTGPTHLTANDLYHEMTKLQLELSNSAMSEDPDVRNLANPMREKFDEYWSQCFLILAIAVVMDPRFKMKLIEFSFSKMYGEDAGKWIKTVDDAIHNLYHDYVVQNFPLLDVYVDHGVPETDMSQEAHFHQEIPHGHHHENGLSHDHLQEVNLYGQAQNGHPQSQLTDDPSQESQPLEEMPRESQPAEDISRVDQPVEEMAQEENLLMEDMTRDTPQDSNPVEETEQETQPVKDMPEEQLPMEAQSEQQPKSEEVVPGEPQLKEALPENNDGLPGESQPAEARPQDPQKDDEGLAEGSLHTESLPEELQQAEGLASEPQSPEGRQAEVQHVEEAQPGGSHHRHEEHSFTISEEEGHHVDTLLQEGHHLEAASSHDFPLITIGEGFSDFELYISEMSSHQQMRSELDQYLEESLVARSKEFEVEEWWKRNRTEYPILSKMAADVLSAPFCTVAADLVFDTKLKKMDGYRSSLGSVTLEALLCAKDWFNMSR